jgi:hypothetical protein
MSAGRRREDQEHGLITGTDLFVAAVMGAAVAVLVIGLAESLLGISMAMGCAR